MSATITTFTGLRFDFVNPTTDMIDIVDIAHHLSNVCRWAGATRQFYSVAQHSVFLSHIVPAPLMQWALLHDAAEAYIGDITRPLKQLLPQIREMEAIIMEVIAAKFNLPFPEPADLCQYDDQCIRFEAETLVPAHDGDFVKRHDGDQEFAILTHHQRRQLPNRFYTPMNQPMAEIAFALRFKELFSTTYRVYGEV